MSMLERHRGHAVLLSETTHWSRAYSAQMTALGVLTVLRPAEQGSVRAEENGYWVVPVNGPRDARFELVEHITESGLSAIVLAGGNLNETAVVASMRGSAVCFRKSLDARDVVNWIHRYPFGERQ